jgi:hypothetical protein
MFGNKLLSAQDLTRARKLIIHGWVLGIQASGPVAFVFVSCEWFGILNVLNFFSFFFFCMQFIPLLSALVVRIQSSIPRISATAEVPVHEVTDTCQSPISFLCGI